MVFNKVNYRKNNYSDKNYMFSDEIFILKTLKTDSSHFTYEVVSIKRAGLRDLLCKYHFCRGTPSNQMKIIIYSSYFPNHT